MNTKSLITFIICVLICLGAGFIGILAMDQSAFEWYHSLNKPGITPPDWLFGPIWTILYVLMGISLWLVIRRRGNYFFGIGVSLFILQLVLNALWTLIFFGSNSPGWAYVNLLILDAVVLITVGVFGKISKKAQYLLLPYVIWLGFATYLNWYIMAHNG